MQDARGAERERGEQSRHDYVMAPDEMKKMDVDDAVRLWRLEEVADAAREIPLEKQPPRLQSALARLVEIPQEAPTPATQEAQPGLG